MTGTRPCTRVPAKDRRPRRERTRTPQARAAGRVCAAGIKPERLAMNPDFNELKLDRVTRRFATAGGSFNALQELSLT